MSKAIVLLVLLALAAGCIDTAADDGREGATTDDAQGSNDEHTFSSKTTMTHSFVDGETEEASFGMSGPGTISYEVVFTVGAQVAGTVVCPVQDTDVKVEVIAPDGSVRDTFEPDARGVMGNGRCGGGASSVQTDEAGTWVMRFSGQGELNAEVQVETASR